MGDTSNTTEYVPIVPMPLRNERRAPVFNGHGAYLAQFFRDFETIARAAQLSESEWLVKILDYTRVDDYDLWSSIGATADMTVSDLERLCDALSVKATVSREQEPHLRSRGLTSAHQRLPARPKTSHSCPAPSDYALPPSR